MRIYPMMRWLSPVILTAYLGFRAFSQPTIASEVLLFNLVAIFAAAAILSSKIPDDRTAQRVSATAMLFWALGSMLSSIDSFFATNFSLFAEIGYLAFYPALFFGMNRALRYESRTRRVEFLDIASLALGGSTLLAIFLIEPVGRTLEGTSWEIFLAIIYPVADLVLLLFVTFLVFSHGLSKRNTAVLVGTLIYTASDLYFLWQTSSDRYIFASLSDSLWLLSFIAISQAFYFPADEKRSETVFNPVISIVTAIASAVVIVVTVLDPEYFPRFAIIPAVATLTLAFARMTFAISDAKRINEEQLLARTDELTGLPNRRRFLASFDQFCQNEGSLLILDLDGFKGVNDLLGHEVGDQLLRQVAKRFERALPKGALLARLGGDEFGVLVPGVEGVETALALRATLSYPFMIAGHQLRLDVSIGEARHDPKAPLAQSLGQSLLRRADEAMYQAKRSKSGVASWSEAIMRHRV
jgi:diguanylate cyclase (GGDEF)-like protein